jgi:hypothetical protein
MVAELERRLGGLRLGGLRQESRCFRRTVKGAGLVMTQQIDIPVEPCLPLVRSGCFAARPAEQPNGSAQGAAR